MSLLAIALLVLVLLSAGYLLYGSFIARQYQLDDARLTPAHERRDDVDFIPTRPFYLLGQHFSAIAAAGPIVGPITACMMFGWLPCLLWIVIGVVFIGAVHDFSTLVASVRHGAGSIAEIARQTLGRRAWLALVVFIWVALIYVIVAFTDVTAATFLGTTEELQGLGSFNAGGAVAAASVMYLLLALIMGLAQRLLPERWRPMWLLTIVFVPATLGAVWLGTRVSTILVFDGRVWHAAILGYCLVASLLPVWVLQQSRGYLGGFVLYLAIAVGLIGVLLGGFRVEQPMLSDAARLGPGGLWSVVTGADGAPPMLGLVFPFLFVTIACGACSGFHGLVCGGTTSKQIDKESHCKAIGFGAMLLEGLVAVVALSTIMIVAPGSPGAAKAPGVIYGEGLARFMGVFLGPDAVLFAKTFGTMAVATFVFDTLDVAMRLARYLLQELVGKTGRLASGAASLFTAGACFALIRASEPGSWRVFWTLFGTSNQLLASLTLIGLTVWLRRQGRRSWFVAIPMAFVLTVTLTAMTLQILAGVRSLQRGGLRWDPAILNAGVALALLALAMVFIVEALRAARRPMPTRA